ncbi:MAG: SDR family oxidoreductase [Rubrivivax sp.]|nr:SDR family oxidoreductase [Rubrivivax sp.]
MTHCLILGASRGIGLELVRQYRAEGAQVSATARDDAGLQRLRDLGAQALPLDVTDELSCAALAPALQGSQFDVVVINAGVYGPRQEPGVTPAQADFDQVMRTNVLGPMRLLPLLPPVLAPGARVGVMSSRMGSIGSRSNGGAWLYRASKAAVNSVLKDASLLMGERAVFVALHPGWVRTDMGGPGADLDVARSVADLRATLASRTPADQGGFFNHDGQPIPW